MKKLHQKKIWFKKQDKAIKQEKINENEIINNRRKHLNGEGLFMGNTGFVVDDRIYFFGFDQDNIPDEETRQKYVKRFYSSNIGSQYGFVSKSRSGNLHYIWYFSGGKKGVYPEASNFRFLGGENLSEKNKDHLCTMLAEGLQIYTEKELKQLGQPIIGKLDMRGLYPSPQKGEPHPLFLDYYNGFNEIINGAYDPNNPTKLLTFKEFINLFPKRTISQTIAKQWVEDLKYLIPCQRRAYCQGLDEGTRNTTNLGILSGYAMNNTKPTEKALKRIMEYLSKDDPDFESEGLGQVQRVLKGERAFCHCEVFCDDLCGDTKKTKNIIQSKKQKTNMQATDIWSFFEEGAIWETAIEKTVINERIEHYFSYKENKSKIALPITAEPNQIIKAALKITKIPIFKIKPTSKTQEIMTEFTSIMYKKALEKPKKHKKLKDCFYKEEQMFFKLLKFFADLALNNEKIDNDFNPYYENGNIVVPDEAFNAIRTSDRFISQIGSEILEKFIEIFPNKKIPKSFYLNEGINCEIFRIEDQTKKMEEQNKKVIKDLEEEENTLKDVEDLFII